MCGFYLNAEDSSETVAGSTFAVHGPVRVGAQGLVVGRSVKGDGGQGGGASTPPTGQSDEHAVLPDFNAKGHLVLRNESTGLDGGIAGVGTRPFEVNLQINF